MLPNLDSSAAWLASKSADLPAFVEAFAVRLETTLPQAVQVVRKRQGLFGPRRVEGITVTVDDHVFVLDFQGRVMTTTRAQVVRGIKLRSKQMHFSEWLSEMTAAVDETSSLMGEASKSLHDLLMS